MTPEGKMALAWLEHESGDKRRPYPATHARIIKAMLSQPRLPEKPSASALHAMRCTGDIGPIQAEEIYAALYAHLTKPAMMWEVDVSGHSVQRYDTFEMAIDQGRYHLAMGRRVVMTCIEEVA